MQTKPCIICGATIQKRLTQSQKTWDKVVKCCSRRCVGLSTRHHVIKRNISNRGRAASDEAKRKMSELRKGRASHMKGKKHKPETKIKIKLSVIQAQTPEVRLKKSLAHRGEKSHNWKGGRMSLKHRMRTNTKYICWRNSVFARDKYQCTHCGDSRGGNLEADHIITVENIFDAFKLTHIDEVIENFLLWEVSNGRTLCKSCHKKRHRVV